ncbi:hypothetical protein [Micromonospora sp. GCM10011541]|uniref:hypothetical protein n=1 Tax=Micromonospora sp. GCM10011541 TaxID=3317336 RepID=UPI0036196464
MGTSTQTQAAITGIDDLVALPVGVKIQDRDGDVFTKTDADTYTSVLYEFPTTYLIDYLPAVVLAEPIEFEVGDEVRVNTPEFVGGRILPGDLAEVVDKSEWFVDVRFADGLTVPFKRAELDLVRRDIESARKLSDGIIDRIIASFRNLLDRAPTATKDPGQVVPTAESVLITSLAMLAALPDGSVVAATIPTKSATRYKDSGNWRAMGEEGTFNYTTAKLAEAGKLRLVYNPNTEVAQP